MLSRTAFICTLPEEVQINLHHAVAMKLNEECPDLNPEDIVALTCEACNGRLCDLEDDIDLDALGL